MLRPYRMSSRVLPHFLIICACLSVRTLQAAESPELRIGCAAVDITPPPGTPMQAPQRPPFEVKLADEALDPLQVKAVVLALGDQKAAIVVCDLASIPIALIEQARREIAAKTDLDPLRVMISATHTHTAPQIRQRFLTTADGPARQKAASYIAALPHRIADAVQLANQQLVSATAAVTVGQEGSISFNRRFLMSDGSVQTNPGKADASLVRQIARPAGPIDPDVGLVVFANRDRSPLAAMVNFAIHLDTVGGNRPSADLASQVASLVGRAYSPSVLTVFAIGAAGNVNHYDLLNPEHPYREKNQQEMIRIGTILAAEVLRASRQLRPVSTPTLRVAREVVRLEMPAEKGAALAARHGGQRQFFDGELVVFNENGKQQFDAVVQAIALGPDLAWVGFPGEMFVEHGLALKRASPFRYTMIHTLANGSIGYVPDRKAYGHGAYEDTVTRCAPGAGETLVDVATRLLVSLKTSPSAP